LKVYNSRQAVDTARISRRKRDNVIAIAAVVIVAAVATAAQLLYFNGGPGTPLAEPASTSTPSGEPTAAAELGENIGEVPDPSSAENRMWTGEVNLNSVALGVELDGTTAPQAVSSLIEDSRSNYFVGKTCHRLVSSPGSSLLQCGSLLGDGASDPTYSFGPIENAPVDDVYPAGTIAMARSGSDAFSNSRQFFIVLADTVIPRDSAGGYTVVGQVTSGLENLKSTITDAGVVGGAADGAPVVPTTITGFTIQ
jgi:peptidyl-prolyl cis-trans isomerase B (cyclophilin B)